MIDLKKIEDQMTNKKENQGQVCLQKLIKLDCRDSNFLYRDQFRKQVLFQLESQHDSEFTYRYDFISLASTLECESRGAFIEAFLDARGVSLLQEALKRGSDSTGVLKVDFYRLIAKYVLKLYSDPFFQFGDRQFQQQLQCLLAEEILQCFIKEPQSSLDLRNLVNRLYIIWKKSSIKMGIRQTKDLEKKLSQSLHTLIKTKNKKKLQKSLEHEEQYLNQLLSSDIIKKCSYQNQISNQIFKLQNQLQNLSQQNRKILQKIQSNIQKQIQSSSKSHQNTPNFQKQFNKIHKKTPKNSKNSPHQIETLSEEIHTTLQLEEIQFIIRNLEQRQLAESMSKILECKKINGEFYYLVAFEQALHVEPKLFQQKEILKLNKLRQTSMFQFYRTGVKSLYSYTCQSYVGFAELSSNRQNLGKYKVKDIFEMMKKTPFLSPQTLGTFNKFHTCHHCKFLYPDYLLKTCKFSSDRQALPKNNFEATLDPDFSQTLCTPGHKQQNKGRVSQRFTTRKKNCLTGYAKINEQYVCGRKYCFSCLKDCYPNDIMNESIFCPFCQGNCTCSRCLRNQKIVKFKNAYIIIGGDLLQLGLQSCIEKLQNKEENMVPKRRGRPKKLLRKPQHIILNKVHKKMRNLTNVQLKLDGVKEQRRITLANKKDKANKRKLMLRQKSLTSLLPKRKRGRPPKNNTEFIKESIKLFKNQLDQKQIESIFLSMNN